MREEKQEAADNGRQGTSDRMDLGEVIRYLVMGGLTTVVSWGTYRGSARSFSPT